MHLDQSCAFLTHDPLQARQAFSSVAGNPEAAPTLSSIGVWRHFTDDQLEGQRYRIRPRDLRSVDRWCKTDRCVSVKWQNALRFLRSTLAIVIRLHRVAVDRQLFC